MTYACADIIYGIDLAPGGRDNPYRPFEDIIVDLSEANLVGTAYNGNGDEPYWLGVSMCGFSEGDADIEGLRLAPTPQDLEEFAQAKAAALAYLKEHEDGLAEKLSAMIEAAQPKVWIAWSSS